MSARCGQCRAPVTDPARCQHGHAQPTSQVEALTAALREMADRLARIEAEVGGLRKERPRPAEPANRSELTVVEVVRRTGFSHDYIYDHAEEFGLIKPPGGRGRGRPLRFDPEHPRQPSRGGEPEAAKPAQRRRSTGPAASDVPLLPVGNRGGI